MNISYQNNYAMIVAICLGLTIFAASSPGADNTSPFSEFLLIDSIPHDTTAFTQGLDFTDGWLIEGTGINGKSSLLKITPRTGDTLIRFTLDKKYFPTGVTVFGDKIAQLTSKSYIGFVHDRYSFLPLDTFELPVIEAFGLTFNGIDLIMSDGTSELIYFDTLDFKETGRLKVTENGKPVYDLGEIEYFDGYILAAIVPTKKVAIILEKTGELVRWIDLGYMYTIPYRSIVYGLAADSISQTLYISGPKWPWTYIFSQSNED